MNERLTWGIALLCMVVGVAWVTRTATLTQKQLSRIESQGQRLLALQDLEAEAGEVQAAMAAVAREMKDAPVSLRGLVDVYVPDAGLRVQVLESEKLSHEWLALHEKVTFDELTGDALSILLQKAEAQRPPWRVEKLDLEPGAVADTLQGEVHFTTLKKQAAGL